MNLLSYIGAWKVNENSKQKKITILQNFNKRAFDIIFSLIILPFITPIIFIIAISIKIKSPNSNPFFLQKRLGLDRKTFTVFKFTTMIPNAEDILDTWLKKDQKIKNEYLTYRKLQNDPRIIKGIGNFLRKSSLDELPQFFNVLLGDMSIVGPRPYLKDEFKNYNQNIVNTICSTKPGITGLWQVTERNDTDFHSRVKKDLEYISERNFWMDIKIILLTIKVMILKEGV